LELWNRGRYVARGLSGEATWVSPTLTLGAPALARSLPPPDGLTPTGFTAPAPPGKVPPRPGPRIVGVSFTWYGEETVALTTVDGTRLQRVVWDYKTEYASPNAHPGVLFFGSQAQRPKGRIDLAADIGILVDGSLVATASDDGLSKLDVPLEGPLSYGVRFRALGTGSPSDAVLLASPALDDVTLYWSEGDPVYLDYHVSAAA